MTFKEKLDAVDPAKLEAAPETDALVAEIIEPNPERELCPTDHKEPMPKSAGRCWYYSWGVCRWEPCPFSVVLGLAFEVLWPWLAKEAIGLVLTKVSLWVEAAMLLESLNFPQDFDKVQPIHFCRAVVAVEKARSR